MQFWVHRAYSAKDKGQTAELRLKKILIVHRNCGFQKKQEIAGHDLGRTEPENEL